MSSNLDLYHKRNQNIGQPRPYDKKNYEDKDSIFDRIQDEIDDFFSKGYNIVRLIIFLIILIYIFYTLTSAMTSLPEGESLTLSFFYNHILQNFRDLRENFPIFKYIFTKISNLISTKQGNFLIFLCTMLGTFLLLICFCS